MSRELHPLPPWVTVGASFRFLGAKHHVRGMIDDQVIVRSWLPRKKRWQYEVFSRWKFSVEELFQPCSPAKRGRNPLEAYP